MLSTLLRHFSWFRLVESKQVLDKLIASVQLDGWIHVHLYFAVSVHDPPAKVPGQFEDATGLLP